VLVEMVRQVIEVQVAAVLAVILVRAETVQTSKVVQMVEAVLAGALAAALDNLEGHRPELVAVVV